MMLFQDLDGQLVGPETQSSFLETFLDTVKQDPEGANLESGRRENSLLSSNIIPDVFTFSSEAPDFYGNKISNEEIKPSRKLVTNNRADRNSLIKTKIAENIHHFGDTKNAKLVSSEFFSHLTKQSRESKVFRRHHLLN